ncbi:MAG: tetratricopeptide repeat protein [Alphaproteobacteria bacterium]
MMRRAAAALLVILAAGTARAQDYDETMRIFHAKRYEEARPRLLALAAAGDTRSYLTLGMLYEQGLGVPKDLQNAAAWYLRAAQSGDPSAMYNLAVLYHFGGGVAKDLIEAAYWYRAAAERGHQSAQNRLATMSLQGEGVRADPVEALMWMTLAGNDLRGTGKTLHQAKRDAMAAAMTPAQVAAADAKVRDWRPLSGPPDARAADAAGVR